MGIFWSLLIVGRLISRRIAEGAVPPSDAPYHSAVTTFLVKNRSVVAAEEKDNTTMQQIHDDYNHFLAPSGAFSQHSWVHEQAFKEAMHQKGIYLPGDVKSDGQFHRFATGNKSHKNGWYVFYGMAGAFGDWSRDIREKWSIKDARLSDQDKEKLREQRVKAQQADEEERRQKHEETASLALSKWASLSDAGQSAYLARRKSMVLGFGIIKSSSSSLLKTLQASSGASSGSLVREQNVS